MGDGNTASDQPPLFFLQHFRGGGDRWDPRMTDGIGRHFSIANGKVTSRAGLGADPKFTMTFGSPEAGYAVFSSKKGMDARLSALRDGALVIRGDFVEVLWFQGLTEHLQPGTA